MDDFYIYYELEPQSHTTATIKAIAPIKLNEMGDMEFIRVSSEVGLSFTKGVESLNRWVVKWLPEFAEMRLYKQEQGRSETAIDFLKIIPTRQTMAQVQVTWYTKSMVFNIRTRGISAAHPNVDMHFFVTRRDDLNIYYYHFSVALSATMDKKGVDIPCPVLLPDKFSVSTREIFDRYQFRTEHENF